MRWFTVLICLAAAPVLAQQPAINLSVTYISREYEQPLPLSLIDDKVDDAGVMGARLANEENQLTARLMGHVYALDEHVFALDMPFAKAAAEILKNSAGFIVADLNAPDLLTLASLPEAQSVLILNTRAPDDYLRTSECRENVWHIAPSWSMKADGLAQYLVWKRWDNWFLVHGKGEADHAYAHALKRAAEKFGAQIVETREYEFDAGSRRVEGGHQQIQTQMPNLTRVSRDYDVLIVADADEKFGDYLPFRTHAPRPVAGTHGLSSTAWHRAFEQYGSMSLHSAFEKMAGRHITESDYLAWLGVKVFSEAALRTGNTDPTAIRAYLNSPDFVVPGFKGIGLSFRTWNQQLRQPLLIAWQRSLISMSPQDAFLHQRNPLDSLGFDLPESECRLNPGE